MHQETLTTGTPQEPITTRLPISRPANSLVTADQGATCISVDLLGGLRVRTGETTMGPRELGGAKPRRILLALLLQRGSPVSKDRLVSLLWDGSPSSCARATLEAYHLRPAQKASTSPRRAGQPDHHGGRLLCHRHESRRPGCGAL